MSERGRRRDAEENRDRILRAARTLLARQPAASMDDLAQAAGVVRRTVYAHFPNRDALLAGLADRCAADLLDALAVTDRGALEPEVALADFALTVWAAGEQYRLLISLAETGLGMAGLRDLLHPIAEQSYQLLVRGREQGRFATHLPLPVLSAALQAMTLAMMRAVNDELWVDDGTRSTVGLLVAAGLTPAAAEEAIREARETLRPV
ncbi:TetR/AcrR family transcriptional regulator [Actinoplanes flavus]|uniref:TetR/AcrR family transcriptional regulator n=1 Tax=Actinoplanes flavus TaxID=2820290 RepID=UPI0027DB6C63|nr:TetR/AcrR family transcriptional regulator [Actinoplanes flavus]